MLIGAHTYSTLPGLPAVAGRPDGLREVLTDPAVWGLPSARCTVLAQPPSAHQVLDVRRQGNCGIRRKRWPPPTHRRCTSLLSPGHGNTAAFRRSRPSLVEGPR
ncbi:hypothetical protein ACH4TX_39230 [Streptomyces sp. NPDC021098]|uniref:hypothetical protein n=1 Tax=unclassified Streptomyces TaxID=2593676 RepID=UPI0037A57E9B